jgi:hypothetical protein
MSMQFNYNHWIPSNTGTLGSSDFVRPRTFFLSKSIIWPNKVVDTDTWFRQNARATYFFFFEIITAPKRPKVVRGDRTMNWLQTNILFKWTVMKKFWMVELVRYSWEKVFLSSSPWPRYAIFVYWGLCIASLLLLIDRFPSNRACDTYDLERAEPFL